MFVEMSALLISSAPLVFYVQIMSGICYQNIRGKLNYIIFCGLLCLFILHVSLYYWYSKLETLMQMLVLGDRIDILVCFFSEHFLW